MTQINNDVEFKQAITSLSYQQQRVIAAKFVEHVIPLCSDERLKRVVDAASNENASQDELSAALKSAKAVTLDSHTRCGAEGNWTDQAGYFVARAAVAAVTPEAQSKGGGPAWQAAMSCRMAQTSIQIDNDDASAVELTENKWQYQILSDFLNS